MFVCFYFKAQFRKEDGTEWFERLWRLNKIDIILSTTRTIEQKKKKYLNRFFCNHIPRDSEENNRVEMCVCASAIFQAISLIS